MTILTLNRKELENHIGKITKEVEEKITMFGTPIEKITDTEFSVEVFPNRPDLLSMHGFKRAILNFLDKKKNFKEYKPKKPQKNYKVTIERSVKKVRPYTVCTIVKNLKLNNEKIIEIIDIQEKLHGSYGRNRKKLAIGIYPLEKIKLPIRYLAKKPEDIKFIPLGINRTLTGRQILSQHPAGREYGNLLKDVDLFPIFEDANKEILSLPPIINSEKTGKITENTKEIFIECSGFDQEYLKKTLNMIVCSLMDMGGEVYEVEIIDEGKKEKYLTPDLKPEKMRFSIENLNKILGLNLDKKELKEYFERMGIIFKDNHVLIPPYRTDILHEIDLAEEIAISYGYDNFTSQIPDISTIAEEDKTSIMKRKISEILIGLEILEISTYHLSTKEVQFRKIGIKEFKDKLIEVVDSKTENNILRNSLFANSIKVLSENSDAAYPHRIFELGKVFYNDNNENSETGIEEKEKLVITICDEKANFTELKQILDYLFKMLRKEYRIEETEDPSFIDGRAGSIIMNNKKIGIIGEVNPNILKNNKIKMPVASLEIDIENLIEN